MEYLRLLFFVAVAFLIYRFKNTQIVWILFAMVVGATIGYDFPGISSNLFIINKLFIKVIKCIIGPLLFSTLILGIASHEDGKSVGRMGWKSILYFEIVTTIALVVGLTMINLFPIGEGIVLQHSAEAPPIVAKAKTWQESILHIMPDNFFKALAEGEILQIVIFTILFAVAVSKAPDKYRLPMIKFSESLAEVMFKFTGMVMTLAPLCVGAAMAYAVSHAGLDVLKNLLYLVLLLYASLVVFLLVALLPVALIIKLKIQKFIGLIKESVLLAFATTSSESALPKAMKAMEEYGVSKRVVSFVMPLGYSFNLDGTTLYLSLASVFVAQVSGIHLSLGTQLALMLSLMLSSKGVAGVPRASLVILIATLTDFDIPDWPVMVMFGIDELMDMARTSVNVIGNCMATAAVGRWENEISESATVLDKEINVAELRENL